MRIATAQLCSAPGDVERNVARLVLVLEALALLPRSVDVLVFPETFLTGYHIGVTALRSLALPLPCNAAECACGEGCAGSPLRAIARAAKRTRVAVLVAYPERAGQDVYNACSLFDSDGALALHYRKAHLWGPYERSAFAAGPGAALPLAASPGPLVRGGEASPPPRLPPPFSVCRLAGVPVAALICYDLEFPEAARSLALAGARVLLAPVAMGDAWGASTLRIAPSRAQENALVLALANFPSGRAEAPNSASCPDSIPMHCAGGSCVAGPDGLHVAALPIYALPVEGDEARQPASAPVRVPAPGTAQAQAREEDAADVEAVAACLGVEGRAALVGDEAVLITTVHLDAPAYVAFRERNPYMEHRRPELYHPALVAQ